MSRKTDHMPYWPAAMDQKTAAAYCGLSVDTFKEVCTIQPVKFTQSTHGNRYLRTRLDEWLSSLDPNGQNSPRRKFGDRIHGGKGEAVRA
jgi:hypothetical protein